MAERPRNQVLEEMLTRLEERAEEDIARVRISGRAVSKSKENVHLATTSGLVAIPLSEIEIVTPRDDDPGRVIVLVRNRDRIRHLLPVRMSSARVDDPIGIPPTGPGDNTVVCFDTSTGFGDAITCDDERCVTYDQLA